MKIFFGMLTAHQIKIFQSLDKKKFRQKHQLFVVEGNKNIAELHNSDYKIKYLFSISPKELPIPFKNSIEITESELRKLSFLQNPKDSFAVCILPEKENFKEFPQQIVLDGIQDPGNLGTIIRLADWFGLSQIVASMDTVDVYNPKVIQASMGSFTRVKVVYKDLESYLKISNNQNMVTAMDGENIFKMDFPSNYNLIFGNEGNGIRQSTMNSVPHKIGIPRFGKHQSTESLNVASSVAIILGNIYSD